MRCALSALLLFASVASATTLPALDLAGTTYVSLTALAQTLGYSTSDAPLSLTVRAPTGVLTVYRGASDASWTPAGGQAEVWSLAAPVRQQGGVWYVSDDALAIFGLELLGREIALPNGQTLTLTFPLAPTTAGRATGWGGLELGNSVTGLAFYESGSLGPNTLSLLLVDVGLMALAYPEQQSALDAFMAALPSGRPLYLVVTALADSPWETSLSFAQAGRTFSASYPTSLNILEGDAASVGPDTPVSGVILLPDWVNLRQPLAVTWSGISASFQFRR